MPQTATALMFVLAVHIDSPSPVVYLELKQNLKFVYVRPDPTQPNPTQLELTGQPEPNGVTKLKAMLGWVGSVPVDSQVGSGSG